MTDANICRRAALHEVALDAFELSPARTVAELAQACSLVHDAYVGLGIATPTPTGMLVSPSHLAHETVVFLARARGRVVGTISVIVDGPAGLPLEHDYPSELATLRRHARRLAEIGSLAVVPDRRRSGVNALLTMASLWAVQHVGAASHCVIGVHPRAIDYYRALYGFRQFGEPRGHCKLRAPVAGLVLEVDRLEEHLRRAHPRPMASGRYVHEHTCRELPACIVAPEVGCTRSRQGPRIAAVEHAASR
ncbi:MAG TPA: GNAT family N-acetyltransferase [Burkholderiales bacterium]|nr:GNAT family N-acetyltransferase [Burkholderiales bacterium]